MIDEQSSASAHDYASNRSAIGAGGVKYCVNRCMKSEVISLTSFVTDGRTDAQHFYVPIMASPWRGTINAEKACFMTLTLSYP